ncbi:MAG: DNA polymerase I, partial [bacterium]|nr:DNA polymerase I [bacterium]
IEHASEVTRKAYRESLENHQDQILLSKRLATIDTAVPVEWSIEALATEDPDTPALQELYRKLEFFSLLRETEPGAAAPEREQDYAALETGEEVAGLLDSIPAGEPVAFAIQPRVPGELNPSLVGICPRLGYARAVPENLFESLRPVLEDPARPKIAADMKRMLAELAGHGIEAAGFNNDPSLLEFLLTADPASCPPKALVERRLGQAAPSSVEQAADFAFELAGMLGAQVEKRGFQKIYRDIDLPLVPVLACMERTGIRVDPVVLGEISRTMETEIARLAEAIHEIAGTSFNINSPKQLGKVLFEDLKLPAPVRYGKGKTQSTAADILEGLAAEHEIARLVLDYRQLAKLKGTYVDALPALLHPTDGRLHTTFNQCGAATGRLSSSNPNLQNIPIRTELGREIRAAFVPQSGWKMLVADYSQIELRLLAHMARDPVLLDAFRRGEDIHTRTAAEVFGVAPLMITPEQRRNAKAVNFGIVYGQSGFGLANQLGIPRKEAERYIKSYFERYSGVRKFIDNTIDEVRKTGVTRTLHGRERPIPDINSRNPNARGFAERTAVNTPLQGTAADLIKVAMIRIDRRLAEQQLATRMLLQVHDELVFETPPAEVESVAAIVKSEMENVHDIEVPLLVDIGIGDNWRDAK